MKRKENQRKKFEEIQSQYEKIKEEEAKLRTEEKNRNQKLTTPKLSSTLLNNNLTSNNNTTLFNINNNNYNVLQTLNYHQEGVKKVIELNNKKNGKGKCLYQMVHKNHQKYQS